MKPLHFCKDALIFFSIILIIYVKKCLVFLSITIPLLFQTSMQMKIKPYVLVNVSTTKALGNTVNASTFMNNKMGLIKLLIPKGLLSYFKRKLPRVAGEGYVCPKEIGMDKAHTQGLK